MTDRPQGKSVLIACDVTAHGGVSVYLSQLARAARLSGWKAAILLDDGPGSDPVERFLSQRGAPVRRAPIHRDRRSDQDVRRLFGAILEAERPDLVHAVLGSSRSLLAPRETCLQRSVPLVMTEQYVARDYPIPEETRRRIRRIYGQAAAVVFVCEENESLARAHFGFSSTRALVIPNSVDRAVRRPRRDRSSRKALTVARLTPQKGIDILIRAAAALRSEGVRISVAGDGKLRRPLQSLARSLGLGESRVRFLGWREDVPELLAAHDLFILPSRTEGRPFALLEALSAGLPCIATAVSGIPETLGHGRAGELVPPEDPAALAAAIDGFFSDPTPLWNKADAAADQPRLDFDAERNLKRLIDVWAEATERSS